MRSAKGFKPCNVSTVFCSNIFKYYIYIMQVITQLELFGFICTHVEVKSCNKHVTIAHILNQSSTEDILLSTVLVWIIILTVLKHLASLLDSYGFLHLASTQIFRAGALQATSLAM